MKQFHVEYGHSKWTVLKMDSDTVMHQCQPVAPSPKGKRIKVHLIYIFLSLACSFHF